MSWKYVQRNDESGQYRTTDEGGGGGGSSTFAGLEDVGFSNLQDGQIPKYNSSTGKWENEDESGGTVTDVQVDGTSVVNPQTGEANIEIPVKNVTYDGQSIVNPNTGEAEIPAYPTPNYPIVNVKVNGTSVVDANKEAQITSYKEVTQSEYNALPDSKLNDGVLYCIKDAGGADGFPPLIYSDEEREIGVWINGKPLYQKTVNIPISSITGNETTINHNIANVDTIYFVDGCMLRGGNLTLPLVTYHTVSSWAASIYNITRTSFVLYLGSDERSRVTNIYVTLKYTKTTDTPGSGIWTPFDVANHKILNAYGQIVKSSNTSVAAIGWATVNLSGNLAEIDFSFKGTVGGGSNSDFEWGLSVDQLQLLNPNIPNLKPMQGGTFWTSKSSNISFLGYGSLMSPTVPSYKYWLPARIYNTSSDVGGYPSSELNVNEYWTGRCYAEIMR